MQTSHLVKPFIALASLLLVAACTSSGGQSWTPPPVTPTPAVQPTEAPTTAPTEAPTTAPTEVPTSGPTEPPASGEPSEGPGEARVVTLQEDQALQILRDGVRVTEIAVTIGETIHFVIENSAGFDHDFYIGPDAALAANQVSDLPGVPTNQSGSQEFDWLVPDNVAELKYGCTVPGHYGLMQGVFVVEG